MAERSARRVVLLIVVALAAGAFVIDAAASEEAVPEIPPPCETSLDGCNDARNAALGSWRGDLLRLEAGLEVRYWFYSVAFILAVLGVSALGARATNESRREVVDDLGILGVAWFVLAAVLMFVADPVYVDIPVGAVFAPAIAFVVVGVIGRLATTAGTAPKVQASPRRRAVPVVGVGLAIVAALLAAVTMAAQGTQGSACYSDVSTAVEGLRDITAGFGLVAAAFGVAALAGRRWIPALVCVTVGPFAAILAALATACLS
jgi:hypothetical protein